RGITRDYRRGRRRDVDAGDRTTRERKLRHAVAAGAADIACIGGTSGPAAPTPVPVHGLAIHPKYGAPTTAATTTAIALDAFCIDELMTVATATGFAHTAVADVATATT